MSARQGLNKKMGDTHEKFLVELLGGRQTKGSGNQWQNQMDGRHNHYADGEDSFAWDGKSTLGQSISITRDMIRKAREQAASESPMLAFRFYRNHQLEVDFDWVAVQANDFKALLDKARAYDELSDSYDELYAAHEEE